MCVHVTLTLQVADLLPAFAVITAVPGAIAVTFPVAESTCAIAVLLEDQTTLSVESAGVTAAVKLVSTVPAARDRLLGETEIPVAGLLIETVQCIRSCGITG